MWLAQTRREALTGHLTKISTAGTNLDQTSIQVKTKFLQYKEASIVHFEVDSSVNTWTTNEHQSCRSTFQALSSAQTWVTAHTGAYRQQVRLEGAHPGGGDIGKYRQLAPSPLLATCRSSTRINLKYLLTTSTGFAPMGTVHVRN